jgi:hypothetical protein
MAFFILCTMKSFEFQQKAICIICFKPNEVWLDFLSQFKNYDIYIAADDNAENYSEKYKIKYPSVHIIQIENDECRNKGFINVNAVLFAKNVTGWEKALLYFSNINKAYKHIWIFEDDVFFYDEMTIKNIDVKFPDSDLLTAPRQSSSGASKNWWWWPRVKIEYEPPYYNAMVCGVRISKNLLLHVDKYAKTNNTLFFLEALFPTIALKNDLKCDMPKEMIQIFFSHKWYTYTLSKKNIFHPVKDIGFHKTARESLKENSFLINITFHIADFFTKLYMNTRQGIKTFLGK